MTTQRKSLVAERLPPWSACAPSAAPPGRPHRLAEARDMGEQTAAPLVGEAQTQPSSWADPIGRPGADPGQTRADPGQTQGRPWADLGQTLSPTAFEPASGLRAMAHHLSLSSSTRQRPPIFHRHTTGLRGLPERWEARGQYLG
jgi:hypothetical protein